MLRQILLALRPAITLNSSTEYLLTRAETSHNSELQHSLLPASTPTQWTWIGILMRDAWGWCWAAAGKFQFLISFVFAGACLLERLFPGAFLLERVCWNVFAGALLRERFCWSVFAGTFLLEPCCGSVCAGAFLLERVCWSVFAGAFLLERFCLRAARLLRAARVARILFSCLLAREAGDLHFPR